MNFNISCPVNQVSFGFVSYNILREIYNRGLSPQIFPIGGVDLSSFDKCGEDFKLWLQSCIQKAPTKYKKDYPEIRLWHVNGSEISHSNKQVLLTFQETDQLTPIEENILNNQAAVLVTSNYTKDVFRNYGVEKAEFVPLGFDKENFKKNDKHPYSNQCTVWGLFGKLEKRKQTQNMLALWTKKFGNNPLHRLHVHCYNGFFHQDPNQCAQINLQLIGQALGGKNYWNINVINKHLPTLTEYSQLINSCDICIDGSANENWSLPSFHATGLGKHVVAVRANGITEWANDENATLVEPNGKEPCYDGVFFHPNQPFSQGNFLTYDLEEFSVAMDKALVKFGANRENTKGLELQNKFKWSDTVDKIMGVLK